jgi:hypothetical protein
MYLVHGPAPVLKSFLALINLGVGWVEGRNPTREILGFVGFHFVQPNLHFFLSS